MDDGDFAGLGVHLAEAVITLEDGTVIARGPGEIIALYTATTRRFPDGTPRTQHVVTNVIVEPEPPSGDADQAAEPDRWTVRARFTVLQATATLRLQVVAAGRYLDTVERGPAGRLRIVEHRMLPRLWGDIAEHLLVDPR